MGRNTVNRCIEAATQSLPVEPLIYHSRFCYCDRVERHAAVVAAFRTSGPCIAFTTQVAEMSLDLSADLLVTDACPVPALIQRFGRLDRRADPINPPPVKPFIVLDVKCALPYERRELDETRGYLERLGYGALSQRDLIRRWQSVDGLVSTLPSAWLDGGFPTESDALRESSVGIVVILARHAQAVQLRPADAPRYATPMNSPQGDGWKRWRSVAGLPVAPEDAISYSAREGARWL